MNLIPIEVSVKGEVITSNLSEFRELVREALGTVNRNPSTDEEFGQAELDCKALKEAENNVLSAKDRALADAESVRDILAALDHTAGEIRQARLELEKVITKKKEEVKASLLENALGMIEVPKSIAVKNFRGSLEAAMKGKRTLDSMRQSLSVTARSINASILFNRKTIEAFISQHGPDLVHDAEMLELTSTVDSLPVELRRRIEGKKLREQAAKASAEAAKARAEAEAANAKARAEADAARGQAAPIAPPTTQTPAKPDPLPTPPEIDSLATGPTDAGEWASFSEAVRTAFQPLKIARAGLHHVHNIHRAMAFAAGVAAAWKDCQTIGEEEEDGL